MKQYTKWFAWAGLAILLLALVAAWSPTVPAHAAARQSSATGDTLTVTMNGSSFPYDNNSSYPIFHLTLVLSAPVGVPVWLGASITLENNQSFHTNSFSSTDGLTYTMTVPGEWDSNGNFVPIGSHIVTASAYYQTTLLATSNPVSFTITKMNMSLSCAMDGSINNMWKPGQAEQVTLTAQNTNTSIPVDWTQGKVNVWFVGSTTSYTNLQPDSSGNVTIMTPTQVGWYTMECSFTGTAYYLPSQMTTSNKNTLISEMQSLGGVKLYTNPTTIVTGTPTQMYVVFKAASGLPTPTGEFVIYIGQGSYFYYTQSIKISSNGTAYVTVGSIPNLYSANNITVHYFGDPYYNDQSVNFTLTNPAIPSGSGGGGTTPGQASATATPHAKATASATGATATTSGGGASSADGGATTTPNASPSALSSFGLFSGGGLIALLLAIALLVVGSGVATFVLLSRRGATSASAGAAPLDPPAPYSGSSFNADTLPQRRVPPQQPPQQWPPEQWPPRQ